MNRENTTQRGVQQAAPSIPHAVGTGVGLHPDDQPDESGEVLPPRARIIPTGVAAPLVLPAAAPARSSATLRPAPVHWDDEEPETDAGYQGYTTRLPTSTRRYTGTAPTTALPRTMIRVTHHPVPPRAHAEPPTRTEQQRVVKPMPVLGRHPWVSLHLPD